MKDSGEKKRYLRKLIDIPMPIVNDLKKMAIDADKSLKAFIQDILIEEVERRRKMNDKNK